MCGNNTIPTENIRVLLAERRHDVRSALKLVLKELLGLDVVAEVSRLDELVANLRNECPDLLVLDWGLRSHRMTKILPRLRTLCPEVRIIAIDNSEETRQLALAAGADEFIAKGSPPEKLVKVLKSICGPKNQETSAEEADELTGLVK